MKWIQKEQTKQQILTSKVVKYCKN